MKLCLKNVVLTLAAALIMGSSIDAFAKRVPLAREEVTGIWVGLTSDDLEFIRLELASKGDGLLGYLFADDQTPCVLRLRTWHLNRGHLSFELDDNLSSCAHDRKFRAVVEGTVIKLKVQGEDWKRRAWLRKEAPLVDRWQKLKAAMME